MSARDVELWVSKDAPVADVMEWAVLTVYAEQADEDGCNAYRSHKTIAAITRMSVDCVKDRTRDLERRGVLHRGDQSAAAHIPAYTRPVVYDIMIPFAWFGSRLDRINRVRLERGRPPLTPEMRPDLAAAPAKRRRKDAKDPGATSTPSATSPPPDMPDTPQGLQAPGGPQPLEGGATSPTTKPLNPKNNQLPKAAPAPPAPAEAQGSLLKEPKGTQPATPAPTLDQRAERLLRPWWSDLQATRPNRVPAQSYVTVKGVVRAALGNGKPDRLVLAALNLLVGQGRPVSGGTLQTAVTEAASHPSAPAEFEPFAVAANVVAGRFPSRLDAEQASTDRIFDDAMARARARDLAEAAQRGASHG